MSEPQLAKERKAEILLLIVVIIWASNYPIAKYGLRGLDPFVFNGIRYVVAATVLAGLFFSGSRWTPIAVEDRSRLLKAGVIANVIYQIAFIIGLSMTSAENAAILLNTSPLWTLLIGARMHRERIRREMWIGMLISLCGVTMIIVGSGKKLEFGGTDLYGDIITFAAAALWGLNNNLQRPLLTRYPTVQVTFVMIAIGTVGLVIAAVPSSITTSWTTIESSYFIAAVVSGATSIAIANYFWSTGVKHLGPGRTAAYNNLVPVLAFIISYFTLDEEVYLIHFVGAAVTVAGVWYARK